METDMLMLEEGHRENIHFDWLKATLRKIEIWKNTELDGI